MKKRMKNKRSSGFTTMEVLAAVAIIVILLGVSAVSVIHYIDILRITKLDNAAREIFMAAENRAVLLAGNQRLSDMVYKSLEPKEDGTYPDVTLTGGLHKTRAEDSPEKLYYVGLTKAVDNGLLDNKSIDPTLLDGEFSDFYIVYDLASGSVTDVVYAEGENSLSNCTKSTSEFETNYDRWWSESRTVRLEKDLLVGWYNGEAYRSAQSTVPPGQPVIDVEIKNGEKLTVTVTVKFGENDGVTEKGVRTAAIDAIRGDGLHVYLGKVGEPTNGIPLTKTDRNGSATDGYDPDTGFNYGPSDGWNAYSWTWVLDSLTNGEQKFNDFDIPGVSPGDDFEVIAYIGRTDKLNYLYDTDVSNSLFAYAEAGKYGEIASSGNTAYIEYLRHLQNLSAGNGYDSKVASATVKKTAAVQVADIQVYGNEVYGDYNFIPIVNNSLGSYTVNLRTNSSDKYWEIRSLNVDMVKNVGSYPSATDKAKLGLFSAPVGMTFENIRLVNATVKAPGTNSSSSVGALAGNTTGDTTITNCWVYWDEYDDLGSDVVVDGETYKYQLTGATVGGLVGTAGGKTNISNSLAATLIKGTSAAGGLVGQLSGGTSTDPNTIMTSYADCYLTGANTAEKVAGLVGDVTTTVRLTNCYAAGFIIGVDNDTEDVKSEGFEAAGLCLGSGTTTATNVYSVIRYPSTEDIRQNASSKRIHYLTGGSENFSTGNVHFLLGGSNSDATYNYVSGEAYDEMTAEAFVEKMGTAFTGPMTTLNSHPYNLQTALSLTYYVYPGLKGLDHYGDWAAQFKEPSMVYYEKYSNNWGLSGGNARTVINSLGSNNVQNDGYGVAFLQADLDDIKATTGKEVTSVTLTYKYGNEKGMVSGNTISYTINTSDLIVWSGNGTTFKAYLIPLRDDLVWSDYFQNCFYWYFEFTLTYKDSNDNEVGTPSTGHYFFNPHFAETVSPYIYENGVAAANPSNWTDWTSAKPYAEAAEAVLKQITIRTPRHLYDLSRTEKYWTRTDTFSQELPLDYNSYVGPDTGSYRNTIKGKPYKQTPIGTADKPFAGAYNGNCNVIENVVPDRADADMYSGLFGASGGTLTNIVYDMGTYELKINLEDKHGLEYYIGGLVGLNATGGLIDNCAVEGVKLNATASNVRLYMGGLVGLNEATVQNSAAEAQLSANSVSYDYIYLGGFVGKNGSSRSISTSYAVGYIDAELTDSTQEAYLCGFAGSNEGTVSNSYAAVGLNYSGGKPEIYGFTGNGTRPYTYYLDQGSFTYRDISYVAKYARNEDMLTESITYDKLAHEKVTKTTASVPVPGMAWAANPDKDTGYNYPTAVKKGNEYVHYGAFPKLMDLGEMGVFYWEKLQNVTQVNGLNVPDEDDEGTYHVYAITTEITVDNGTVSGAIGRISTLSEARDDGKAVSEYGYGYYYKTGQTVGLTVENIAYYEYVNEKNVVGGLAGYVEDAERDKALGDLMEGYTFRSWSSYHEGGLSSVSSSADKFRRMQATPGLGTQVPTGQSPNRGSFILTMTKNGTVVPVKYTINPHFAASMSVLQIKDTNVLTNDGEIDNSISSWFAGNEAERKALTTQPGTTANPYQVRSGMQLQQINWFEDNYVDVSVGRSTYYPATKFPYFGGPSTSGKYVWKQTHDIDWTGEGSFYYVCQHSGGTHGTENGYISINDTDNINACDNKKAEAGVFYSIAHPTVTNSTLPGWFEGSYDGGSYTIKNLYIYANMFFYQPNALGLFGALNNKAELKDIVLFSEGGTDKLTVWGRKDGTDADDMWYAAGVLAGVALDSKIENCAVAGYTIVDQTRNARTTWTDGGWYISYNGNQRVYSDAGCTIEAKTENLTANSYYYFTYNDAVHRFTYHGVNVDDILYTGNPNWSIDANPDATYSLSWANNEWSLTYYGVTYSVYSDEACSNLAGRILQANQPYYFIYTKTNGGYKLYRFICSRSGYDYSATNIYSIDWSAGKRDGTLFYKAPPAYDVLMGGAIGGLVGIAKETTLSGCAAVVDIDLTQSFVKPGTDYSPGDEMNSEYFQPYTHGDAGNSPIRVGGLVGTTTGTVTNCYTGGSITVASNAHDAAVYAGRIIGGIGAGPFGEDAKVNVSNCYSYMDLPNATNRAVVNGSYNISGTGENPAGNATLARSNNYYYGTNMDVEINATSVTYRQLAGLDQITSNDTTLTVKTGTIYQLLNRNNADTDGTKGPNFYKVTDKVNGLPAAGRYTYVPSSRTDLSGIDYPFPTVLMVEENRVHYGAWTLKGIVRYAKHTNDTYSGPLGATPVELDLFTPEEGKDEAGPGVHTEYLRLELDAGVTANGTWTATIEEGKGSYISVTLGTGNNASTTTKENLTVTGGTGNTETLTITALQDFNGPVKVTVSKGGYTQEITVYITANVGLEPAQVSIFPRDKLTVPLSIYGVRPGVAADKYYRGLKGKLEIDTESVVFKEAVLAVTVDGDTKTATLNRWGSSKADDQWVYMGYAYKEDRKSVEDNIHGIAVKLLDLPEHEWTLTKDSEGNEAWTWTMDFSEYEDFNFEQKDVSGYEGYAVNVQNNKITLTASEPPTSRIELTVSMTTKYDNGTEDGIELKHEVKITVPKPVTAEEMTVTVTKNKVEVEDGDEGQTGNKASWNIEFDPKYTLEKVMLDEENVTPEAGSTVTITRDEDDATEVTLTVTLTTGDGLRQTFDVTVVLPKATAEPMSEDEPGGAAFNVPADVEDQDGAGGGDGEAETAGTTKRWKLTVDAPGWKLVKNEGFELTVPAGISGTVEEAEDGYILTLTYNPDSESDSAEEPKFPETVGLTFTLKSAAGLTEKCELTVDLPGDETGEVDPESVNAAPGLTEAALPLETGKPEEPEADPEKRDAVPESEQPDVPKNRREQDSDDSEPGEDPES